VSIDAPAATVDSGQQGDIFSGTVAGIEGGLSEVAQVASGDESTTVEFRGDGSLINAGREDRGDSGEAFGGEGVVEETLRGAAEFGTNEIINPAAELVGQTIRTGASTFAAGSPVTADDPARAAGSNTTGTRAQDLSQGTVEGAGSIANVPGLAVGAIELGEFGAAGVSQTASGDGGQFAQDAAEAGALTAGEFGAAAQANPDRVAGQLIGSTLASGSAIGAARRVGGPRAGRAASTAIQPGEEALIFGARRGIPGTRRLASRFGDVSVRDRASEFRRDEGGQLGRSRAGESDNDDVTVIGEGEFEPDVREPMPPQDPRTDVTERDLSSGRRDITEGQRRRDVRERAEEGGMSDSERFQSGRGDTLMERRAQRRRQEAQEREVTEPEGPTATESSVPGLRGVLRTEATTDAQAGDTRRAAGQPVRWPRRGAVGSGRGRRPWPAGQ